MLFKYDPYHYVDYLCDSMKAFQEEFPKGNSLRLNSIWNRLFFDTKQAVKEHLLSVDEREHILDYYGGLIPDD